MSLNVIMLSSIQKMWFFLITYKGKSLVRKIRRTAFCQVSQASLKIIVVKEILLKKKKKTLKEQVANFLADSDI